MCVEGVGGGGGGGGGGGERLCDKYDMDIKPDMDIKLCILSPKRISCNSPKDTAWKQVTFQMI